MRTGLLGGTFDPPHNAHVAIALAAIEAAGLDSVEFMPSGVPPHKVRSRLSPVADRLAMARLAALSDPRLGVCEAEVHSQDMCYTLNTWRTLVQRRRGEELYLVLGGDCVRDLPKWFRFADLVREANFVILNRPGMDAVALARQLPLPCDLVEKLAASVVPGPLVDISSTLVRGCITRHEPITGLVPSGVAAYIAEKNLYRE